MLRKVIATLALPLAIGAIGMPEHAQADGKRYSVVRSGNVCSREIWLGDRGKPCLAKIARRAERAGLYADIANRSAVIPTRRGVVVYHCIGRNRAVAVSHAPGGQGACRGIERTASRMGLGPYAKHRKSSYRPEDGRRHDDRGGASVRAGYGWPGGGVLIEIDRDDD